MPRIRSINRDLRIKTSRIYDSAGRLTGLTIDAHMPESRVTHGETPSVCLIWRGADIRCIDWEVRHEFADGTVVEGWHEHLWDDKHQRQVGRSFAPPLALGSDLEGMFVRACQQWNTTIMTRRDQALREVVPDGEE